MNTVYIVAGVIVVALLVYLFVALLKPELFE
jgi:K+-transporting ATPase KdpF subunit